MEIVLAVSSNNNINNKTKWYKVEFEIGVPEDLPVNETADIIINVVDTSLKANRPPLSFPVEYTGPKGGRIKVETDNYTKLSYSSKVVRYEPNIASFGDRTIDDDDKEEIGIGAIFP